MVLLESLKEADSSFQIIANNEQINQVRTLCSIDNIQEGGIVFIKNNKFYKSLIDNHVNSKSLCTIGVVFLDSFFKTKHDAEQSEELKKFGFYATVENIDLSLSRFSKLFFDEIAKTGNDIQDGRDTATANVHPTSSIAKNVFLGDKVKIAANVTIHAGCAILSNSKIGENTVLYPNVTVYRNVTIGKNCRIHGNTTIGSDGYGYNFDQGKHLKVWHFGGVVIGDSVEIGSGTSIDQGTFSPTIIGEETKIDNQVHMAHNCKIGKGVLITGQAGFSGSVSLGDYVVMGGCAQFAPGVVIGNYAQIGGMAGVTNDIPEKTVFAGHPARPIKEWLKSVATLRRITLKQNNNVENEN